MDGDTVTVDGEVERAYRTLRASVGVLRGTDRALLRLEGNRCREVLAGLVTRDVSELEAGKGVYAFLLTPKGRPVAELRVLAPPEGSEPGPALWLDLPVTCLEGARRHLDRYLPPRLARHDDLAGWTRLSLVGPRAGELVGRALAVEAPGVAPLHFAPEGVGPLPLSSGREALALRREEIEGPGFDLYLGEGDLEEAAAWLEREAGDLGGGPVGRDAWDVLRVERGLPVYGKEIHEGVLPQETGQEERALEFGRGCYTGQEVVARIHFRGRVNRHLRGLRIDPALSTLPGPGTPLYRGTRERGVLTSVVRSPRLGPVALGYVRREIEPGAALSREPEGAAICRVVELPFPS